MQKRHLALGAGVVLLLIGLAVVLTTVRPSPAPKIRCSKIAVLGDSLNVTLEVNNRTPKFYSLAPIRLEQWDQNQWTKCFDGIGAFSASGGVGVTQTFYNGTGLWAG